MLTFKMRMVALVLVGLSGAFVVPGCVAAADDGGTGGGASDGSGEGGEPIGEAVQAETVCCCPSTVSGSVKCSTVYSDHCPPYYELSSTGPCNAPVKPPDSSTTGNDTCSASGRVASGADVHSLRLALLVALAIGAVRRRSRRVT